MKSFLLRASAILINLSFYLLFFLVPLLFTPLNYELFEYNKMMAVYALTVIIAISWIVNMILNKQIKIRCSPFDLPLLLFLLSQIISTVFSIDVHVSIFGYYSRFNGGLLSVISYILLYYAFLTHIKPEKIKKYLIVAVSGGLLVAIYGILEHFGIDKNIWVQDVQNRVFSTLGQPNWLGAYLAILIPITFGLGLNPKSQASNNNQIPNPKHQNPNWNLFGFWNLTFWILSIVFYICLIFTRSRSGLAGFWVANFIFWLILYFKYKKNILKTFLILNSFFLILNFLMGQPFPQLDKFTFSRLSARKSPTVETKPPPVGTSALETGVTESGNIRKIVWKGAVDIIRHYPLFGSGVETFAFSYYQFRPVEHNMTSEWDFLYNKAHNEYLNYGATTGLVGLGTYLLFIASFIFYFVKSIITKFQSPTTNQIPNHKPQNPNLHLFGIWNLEFGIFCGWLSILITNFLGFSVVVIQIFFFLIPAISYLLLTSEEKIWNYSWKKLDAKSTAVSLDLFQLAPIIFVLLAGIYLLITLSQMWLADVAYARGYNQTRAGNFAESYQDIRAAINLNSREPLYFDDISLPAAQLSVAAEEQKETTISGELKNEAIAASNLSTRISPNNVNFWKNRTRVFYTLATFDPKYMTDAISALIKAEKLSPTDPKIAYNLGLLYAKIGDLDKAINYLEKATRLKPDYKDFHYALSLFYKENKQNDKARAELEFILTKISSGDAQAKKQLEEIK